MTGNMTVVLTQALKTLRELELHLKFFNLVFADVLWFFKVYILCETIFAGFSAIRLIHTNPILGCLYSYCCFVCIIAYIGMFQFAYKVTEKMADLKREMEVRSAGSVNSGERKYWARVLRSIPRMGMSLGGFGRVEREAVPIFLDFSVNQIVSLLLAFP